MSKRLLIIIPILLILAAGAWYYFSRPAAQQGSTPATNALPFGQGGPSVPSSGSAQGGGGTSDSTAGAPAHLFKLSDAPVAGAVAFLKGGALDVRYVERATGHIYEIDPTTLVKTELVNTTLPKIYEAIWKPDGSAVILRSLDDSDVIQTSSVALIPPSGTSTADLYTTKSTGLPAGATALAVGQKNIFYTVSGLPQIVTALFDGSKAATVWSAPFSEWRITSTGDSAALITPKASSRAPGYAYVLSMKSGAPQKLLGPLTALAATQNKDLTRIAYSYEAPSGLSLETRDLSKGAVYSVKPATFAEKCVWSQKSASVLYCGAPRTLIPASEPDLWYQGVTSYSDRIWKFDVDTDYSEVLADPETDFKTQVDAEKLFLSPNEDYLFFINKNDLSLWALKLD